VEFASEEATVVVGTVIDPELTDELKVTVVATGLGSEAVRSPLKVVDSAPRPAVAEAEEVAEEPDYREFDRPTALRNKPRRAASGQAAVAPEGAGEEYFDIPAFLRRQAD
jgi:cell division protein FtsZ